MRTMKTLAFDTSTKYLSIALFDGDTLCREYHEDIGIKHSDVLVPEISAILNEVGWSVKDIGLFAVGIGPGSFTGLRIGVATVKGFASVFNCDVIGVPDMDAIVAELRSEEEKVVAPVLDARKGKIYTCLYRIGKNDPQRISDHKLITMDDFLLALKQNVLLFGDAVASSKKAVDSCPKAEYYENITWYPKAKNIGKIGIKQYLAGERTDPADLDPMYLHARDCSIKRDI